MSAGLRLESYPSTGAFKVLRHGHRIGTVVSFGWRRWWFSFDTGRLANVYHHQSSKLYTSAKRAAIGLVYATRRAEKRMAAKYPQTVKA